MFLFKPFLPKVSILYPMKTSQNLWFSSVFRRLQSRDIGQKWIHTFNEIFRMKSLLPEVSLDKNFRE